MKYTNIDIASATPDQIRSEIVRMKQLSFEYKNEEQGCKLILNSIYGALANKWLACFNTNVAETITAQGRDIWHYAETLTNKYFADFWHLDTELHEKLGITKATQIKKPVVIAGDTDSCYVSFEEVVKSCDFPGHPKDLILKINEFRLTEYLNKAFEKYSKKWNTKNHMDFELENIAESGIWLAKKKYLLDLAWQDGINIEHLSQIVYKGVELAQSSTPPFAREKLKELVSYIFSKKKTIKMPELTKMLRDLKVEFKIAEPDKLSASRKINEYTKWIKKDISTGFVVEKGTPVHVRAGGYYNHLLNSNKFKSKYQLIRDGDKVKWYYAKARKGEEDVFAYLPGMYPYEFAPAIDYDLMFIKTIIDPVNRLVRAMNFPEIPSGLQIAHTLF